MHDVVKRPAKGWQIYFVSHQTGTQVNAIYTGGISRKSPRLPKGAVARENLEFSARINYSYACRGSSWCAYHIRGHPLVYAYDLVGHVEVIAHITDLKPHQYQNEIDRYLVIPQETLKLLNVLRQALRLQDRDVISGKAGGCLILLKGDPGLGKTLTAQVFAEQNNRPLYELQCSQLGISPPEVEENLRNAPLRARRWPKQHDLPDNITGELEKRLQRADWNELLKPILRGIPAKIDVVDTTGPERTQRSGRTSG